MKKVLVTGASGFIGRHCLPLLTERGYEVYAVSTASQTLRAENVCWHKADLLQPGVAHSLVSAIKPTHLLHLAWHVAPGRWATTGASMYFQWLQASLELLRAFHMNSGKRVVMAGSCTEYDWRYGYCSESLTPLAPNTPYGEYKNIMQNVLNTYSREAAMSSAWGRVFFLFGPHEHRNRLVSSVIRSLLLDEEAECTAGIQIRDFLYVKDVADAFSALLDSDLCGPVNIASGKPVTLKEIIYAIADNLQKRDLVRLGAVPIPPNETPMVVGDITRLGKELGWTPKYQLQVSIDETIDWWKKELQNSHDVRN